MDFVFFGLCLHGFLKPMPLVSQGSPQVTQTERHFWNFAPSVRFDCVILPNCKETTTSSKKLCFDEPSRTSLTGLIFLLRNEMFDFTPMNPVGSVLGRRHWL
jgi:hypothetical protein